MFPNKLHRRRLLGLLLVCGLWGCQSNDASLPLATTPEDAQACLTRGLEAWKAGTTQTELARAAPPLFLADDDFRRGWKLLAYERQGEPAPVGTGLSFRVALTILEPGQTTPRTRTRTYRVVTSPQQAITKEDGP